MASAAPLLLAHFRHPSFSDEGPSEYDQNFPQIWVPGPTHLDMLHYLAAAYARSRWERDDIDVLRALGNLCNALHIEMYHPGQQTVVSATEALRSCWVFPTAPVRQGHLGHLLGWLTPDGDRDSRLAAARAAERESVATVLDPAEERDILGPLVEDWTEARRVGNERDMSRAAGDIEHNLTVHLRRRWNLAAGAAKAIAADPRSANPGLVTLVDSSMKRFFKDWGIKTLREEDGEEPYWRNVFTDRNPRRIGKEFHHRIADDELARHLLVHGDTEMQREELAAGRGVVCTVTAVDQDDESWSATLEYPDLPTVREGDYLAIAGMATTKLVLEELDLDKMTLSLRPTWKRAGRSSSAPLAPYDPRWHGRSVVLLKSPSTWLTRELGDSAGRNFGPGDITLLLDGVSGRHSAADDEGVVLETSMTEGDSL